MGLNRVRKWLPVDHYTGGIEHATTHHLYARFIWKAMLDTGHLPPEVGEEPFKQLRLHGWILHEGAKMSKSRGNVVNPDKYVSQYGADVMRAHMLFAGDYVEGGDFRDSAISGIVHFYHRLWDWVNAGGSTSPSAESEDRARRALHKAIKKVSEDLPALRFNTAIAILMETVNVLRQSGLSAQMHHELARDLVLLLAPIAPFLAEELWEGLGGAFSVHQQRWPSFDASLVAGEVVIIPIQINGKTRGRIEVEAGANEEAVTKKALALPEMQKHVQGKRVVKSYYVPNRLINLVVE